LGRTISEKIFQAHSGKECKAGDLVIADVDLIMAHDGNRPLALEVFERFGKNEIFCNRKMVYIIDHYTPASDGANAERHRKIREFCSGKAITLFENEGICHQLIPEKGFAAPGDLIIGSDSHTCTYGALNAFSTGVGVTDLAAAMLTGKLWFKIPESIKINLNGSLPEGVFSKDLVLLALGQLKSEGATYRAIEFVGEVISNLSIDARLTISNMAVEMGAKAGIMEADRNLSKWLEERKERSFAPVFADRDAEYFGTYKFDVSSLSPQVSKPHNVDQVAPVEDIGNVPIQQANLVSCTNGRLEDLAVAAKILKGKKIHRDVRFLVVPASRSVLIEGIKRGLIQTLVEAGAVIRGPGCAGCEGGSAFGVPASGETVISSANRNFKGRLGNPEAFVYLASPATVVASALEGKIADCRKYLR
jgi:3-isopropylmalate/(R)-2-methylmalate dehydratase large subunit